MMITPISPDTLDEQLEALANSLGGYHSAIAALGRIAAARGFDADGAERWHAQAVQLADSFGMDPLDEAPEDHLSWDGKRVRTRTEPAVLLHEIAHFQITAADRRFLPDFGLGAGPESGATHIADQAQIVTGMSREREEQMTSLLGILWEAELGQRAIDAFLEQNWLEGAGRPSAAAFFIETLQHLIDAQLVDPAGRPRLALNRRCDAAFRPIPALPA